MGIKAKDRRRCHTVMVPAAVRPSLNLKEKTLCSNTF